MLSYIGNICIVVVFVSYTLLPVTFTDEIDPGNVVVEITLAAVRIWSSFQVSFSVVPFIQQLSLQFDRLRIQITSTK